ncbi:MAG: thiamine pyrophosphate-dependent enzyme [Thioalkalispiraceae bacterium]|jgi:2-oxoglutarate ferredoxin oxidoreductase subunit beta
MTGKRNDRQRDKSPFHTSRVNDWCAGCGDFGILHSLDRTLTQLQLSPDKVAVFGGIGCSGKTPYYLASYGIHTLHGRVLPFASGAKLANPELTVIAVGGDGDGLSIGAGHLVGSGRRNIDLTYILFDNGVYGLTKGQASPTLRVGEQTKAMPEPSLLEQTNPIALGLASGFTWIGRGYAYDTKQLCELIEQAIRHRGSSMLTVLQPCPTYNELHDKDWYSGKDLTADTQRLYSLQEEDYDPVVPTNADQGLRQEKMLHCLSKAYEWGQRISTGVFFQDLSRPTLSEQLARRQSGNKSVAPAMQTICNEQGESLVRLNNVFDTLSV